MRVTYGQWCDSAFLKGCVNVEIVMYSIIRNFNLYLCQQVGFSLIAEHHSLHFLSFEVKRVVVHACHPHSKNRLHFRAKPPPLNVCSRDYLVSTIKRTQSYTNA